MGVEHQPDIYIYIGLSPLPVIVTTRIITFLVGNPNLNFHFHYYWEGGQPNIYIYIQSSRWDPSWVGGFSVQIRLWCQVSVLGPGLSKGQKDRLPRGVNFFFSNGP